MDRRIFGLETEYGVTATPGPADTVHPSQGELAFSLIPYSAASSEAYLRNGARLYNDHGSHPEYATAECDSVRDVIAQDKAGERILEGMLAEAAERWARRGFTGNLYLFKNNVDSQNNTYGCHENYLVGRSQPFSELTDALMPFFVSRQLLVGAGHVARDGDRVWYEFSQRARHMNTDVGSDSTTKRAIIHTRDEPHADVGLYRRLHVLVGDANMSETTTLLKLGSTDLVLQMIEAGETFSEWALEDPVSAIRSVSDDISGLGLVRLKSGDVTTGLELQQAYFAKARDFAVGRGIATSEPVATVLELWERTLRAVETGNIDLIRRDIDWAIKLSVLREYQEKHGLDLSAPRIGQLDLAYHDINRHRGLYYVLQKRGRVSRVLNDLEIFSAKRIPPQTTRAKVRGEFVREAESAPPEVGVQVEWARIGVRVGEMPYRHALCRDPFATEHARVRELTEFMRGGPDPGTSSR